MDDAGLAACFGDALPQHVKALMDRIAARTRATQVTA
jgi:hypothetical protein